MEFVVAFVLVRTAIFIKRRAFPKITRYVEETTEGFVEKNEEKS